MRRQGKKLEDPAREVTVMFIRHCPDPELSDFQLQTPALVDCWGCTRETGGTSEGEQSHTSLPATCYGPHSEAGSVLPSGFVQGPALTSS